MGISRYQERYYNDINSLAKSMPRVEKLLEKLLEKELAAKNPSEEDLRKEYEGMKILDKVEEVNPDHIYAEKQEEKKIEFEVFDNGIVNYAKDDMVNLGLNGLMEFDKDLLSYWAWLHTTSEGKNTKNMGGTGKDSIDIGDFNEKYPNSYWDLESRTWFKEIKA